MKRLFLLRHAQALPAQNGQDIDRTLSPKGLEDALALGKAMKLKNYTPDYILCSSARRTRLTCENVLKGLDAAVHAQFTKTIYEAGVGELFHLIQQADKKIENLMLIGHNPTIYELASKLSADGHDTVLGRLAQGYAPASFSVIECDCESWQDLDPDTCRIVEFMDPLDYNAPATPARWT